MTALTARRTSGSHDPASFTAPTSITSAAALGDRVRLHVTPFNPDLLPKIIPPSLQSEVSNISFHQTLVSPEKGFGYVELPVMAAEKLKKKLNGSILKGEKVKLQNAKPKKQVKVGDVADLAEEEPVAETERPQRKKRKITERVEDGVELPEGRTVKRGWTEPTAEKKHKRERTTEEQQARKEKKDKKREASKYTNEPELMFKAKLEPTAATTASLKAKKSTDSSSKKDKKDRKAKDQAVIHEFANTKKHAGFLRENQVTGDTNMTTEYVEGKGWVDADGNVVEAERPRKKGKAKKFSVDLVPSIEAMSTADEKLGNVDFGSAVPVKESMATKPAIHPLEALYKRSKEKTAASNTTSTSPKKPPPINTSKAAFSFFDANAGAGDDEDDEARAGGRPHLTLPPMTPKTKQDFNMRGLRSAAPEPDTATQERRFPFSEAMDRIGEDEEDEGDEEDGPAAVNFGDHEGGADGIGGSRPESEFRKWFYEHRGENNRAWRQKRRDAMKVKRQRENRRLARRLVV